jgi:hypothetical protein
MIFSRAAPRIAEAVVAAGAPLPVAYAAVSIVLMEATEGAQQALEELGYDCGDDGIHFKDRFPVEWGAFADRLLEPVDLEAWERSTRSLAYFADDWQPAQPALRESDAEAAD